jgi:hypothetical protein
MRIVAFAGGIAAVMVNEDMKSGTVLSFYAEAEPAARAAARTLRFSLHSPRRPKLPAVFR